MPMLRTRKPTIEWRGSGDHAPAGRGGSSVVARVSVIDAILQLLCVARGRATRDLFACAHILSCACARIESGATLGGVSVQTRSSSPAEIAAQCPTDSPLNGPGGEAWFGLLHTYAALVRKVDAELAAQHRMSLSAFELLVRLSTAPNDGSLSVTELARQVVISPS